MIPLANTKSVEVVTPVSVTAAATAAGTVDTLGFDYAIIDVFQHTGSAAATSIAVTEADSGTSYTAITALTSGTATGNFTVPTVNTTLAPVTRLNIDLRKRKRYLKVTITGGSTGIVGASAVLGRAEQTKATTGVEVTA